MLVLGQDNLYAAANMTVKVTDNTVYQNTAAIEDSYPVPDFNILVPMVQDAGATNVIELYRPGTQDSYEALHGMPNALKYGFGPDFIYDTLAQNAGVGVYTVNLRGDKATMANVVLKMDYHIDKHVRLVNKAGQPVYIDAVTGKYTTEEYHTDDPTDGETTEPTEGDTTNPTDNPTEGDTTVPTDGETTEPTEGDTTNPTDVPTDGETTEPTDDPTEGDTTPTDGETTVPIKNTEVYHDILKVRYYTGRYEGIHSWAELVKKLDGTDLSDNTEVSGTLPIFAVAYRGASNFGNNSYFSMHKFISKTDHNTYYYATAYDGINTMSTDATLSLYAYSGIKYNTSYFIENQFNNAFNNLRMHMFAGIDALYDLYNRFLSEYKLTFPEIDIFTFTSDEYTEYTPNIQFMPDPSDPSKLSIDPTEANAFVLRNGSDDGTVNDKGLGNKTYLSNPSNVDALLCDFFESKILDIDSVLRYKVSYIPDVGYSDAVKASIVKCIKSRNRFTTATLMVGNDDFKGATLDRESHYSENMPNVRLIAKCQSPMMYNPYCRRVMTYPSAYFDCMEWVRLVGANGNPFMPFAGANVRWRGFIEDTMIYPTEDPDYINALVLSRINTVMKDNAPGAYLSDQVMNTVNTSDLTEFNNSFIISSMLYDTLNIVHQNHFKFNESTEVARFTNLVDEHVNTKYRVYSASLDIKVYRKGTVGRASQTNVISITVDLKDINRYAQVEITLIDE